MAAFLAALAEFGPIIELVVSVLQRKKISQEALTKAIEAAETAASDAEMKAEFPNG